MDPVQFRKCDVFLGEVVHPFVVGGRHLQEVLDQTHTIAQRVGYLALAIIEFIPLLNYLAVAAGYLYSTTFFHVDEEYIRRHVSIGPDKIVFNQIYLSDTVQIGDITIWDTGGFQGNFEDLAYFSQSDRRVSFLQPTYKSAWLGPLQHDLSDLGYFASKEVGEWFRLFNSTEYAPR